MKKVILVGMIAVLAACSNNNGAETVPPVTQDQEVQAAPQPVEIPPVKKIPKATLFIEHLSASYADTLPISYHYPVDKVKVYSVGNVDGLHSRVFKFSDYDEVMVLSNSDDDIKHVLVNFKNSDMDSSYKKTAMMASCAMAIDAFAIGGIGLRDLFNEAQMALADQDIGREDSFKPVKVKNDLFQLGFLKDRANGDRACIISVL